MDIERFRRSPAGRLVKGYDYWAFVPNPLPPKDFGLDRGLSLALSDADRALGELAGLGRTLPNPHVLIRPFIRREAVLSSRIEGTQADLRDLYAYEVIQQPLPGFGETKSAKQDVREVSNYVQALEYGLERLQSFPLSLRFLRELHGRLMEGVRGEHEAPGEFRRSQNWIGPPGSLLKDATFVPPPVDEMHQALDAFEKYLYTEPDYPPLVRMALIHYQFEAIHPFLDGNGRVGRLLTSLLLCKWDLLPLPLLYLSAYFEQKRDAYYDGLLAVSRDGRWKEWVAFFLRGVESQSRDAIRRAKALQDLQASYRDQLLKARASLTVLGTVDKLFETPVISSPLVQRWFGVSRQTANNTLQRLERSGIIVEITGSQRSRVYIASELLDITEREA